MKPAIVDSRCWKLVTRAYGPHSETGQLLIVTILNLRKAHRRAGLPDPGLRKSIAILARVERDVLRRTR